MYTGYESFLLGMSQQSHNQYHSISHSILIPHVILFVSWINLNSASRPVLMFDIRVMLNVRHRERTFVTKSAEVEQERMRSLFVYRKYISFQCCFHSLTNGSSSRAKERSRDSRSRELGQIDTLDFISRGRKTREHAKRAKTLAASLSSLRSKDVSKNDHPKITLSGN